MFIVTEYAAVMHSAILSTFIKLTFVIRTFVLSILVAVLHVGFTVVRINFKGWKRTSLGLSLVDCLIMIQVYQNRYGPTENSTNTTQNIAPFIHISLASFLWDIVLRQTRQTQLRRRVLRLLCLHTE